MQFHDKRRCTQGEAQDCIIPLSRTLERLVAAVLAGTTAENPVTVGNDNKHIVATDYDPKTGLETDHLELNFEPLWLDERFKARWKELFGTTLHSRLLENTEWKRYAWGVWEE